MSEFTYDLAVAYRIFPGMSSNAPPVFQTDKFKLSELCLRSFKASIGSLRVKMWVLLNSCPPQYDELFRSVWGDGDDLVLLHYPGIPPGATLHEQSQILARQTDAEIVYFAEDDYFYLPGEFEKAVKFLREHPDADFATPYEHPHHRETDLHRFRHESRAHGGKIWISGMSTTHTFLARRSALLETEWMYHKFFKAFRGKTSPDLGMWMALTKKRVYSANKLLRWVVRHPHWSGSILYAWYYCWRQILFGRRYTLWIPRPSIATHMIATELAPGVDWKEAFQRQLKADLNDSTESSTT